CRCNGCWSPSSTWPLRSQRTSRGSNAPGAQTHSDALAPWGRRGWSRGGALQGRGGPGAGRPRGGRSRAPRRDTPVHSPDRVRQRAISGERVGVSAPGGRWAGARRPSGGDRQAESLVSARVLSGGRGAGGHHVAVAVRDTVIVVVG